MKKIQKPDLQYTLFVLLVCVTLIAFAVISITVSVKTREFAEKSYLETARNIAYHHGIRVTSKLSDAFSAVKIIADVLKTGLQNPDKIDRDYYDSFFKNIVESDDFFFGAWAIFGPGKFDGRAEEYAGKPGQSPNGEYIPYAYRENGKVVFQHDDFSYEKNQEYYTIPVNSKKTCIMDPYADPTSNNAIMTSICIPVLKNDSVAGVCGIDILLSRISEYVNTLKPLGRSYAFIAGNNGLIVGHPRIEFCAQPVKKAGMSENAFKSVVNGFEHDEIQKDPFSGKKTLFKYIPLYISDFEKPWIFCVAVPFEEFEEKAHTISRMVNFTGGTLFVIVGMMLFSLSRSVVGPMHRSQKELRHIFDHVDSAVILFNQQGQLIDANKSAVQLFSIGNEKIENLSFIEDLSAGKNDFELLHEMLMKTIDGMSCDFEWNARRMDESVFFSEIFFNRLVIGVSPFIIATIHNVTERKQIEKKKTKDMENLRKQQETIMKISCSDAFSEGNIKKSFREITELAARTLEVKRVSIWLGNPEESLMCEDLYEIDLNAHSRGHIIIKTDYPAYFRELSECRTIDASEARIDMRTKEYLKTYLEPLNIFSMLDSPIRLSGKVAGVVCFEHTDEKREWEFDEIRFAGEIADHVAQALMNAQKKDYLMENICAKNAAESANKTKSEFIANMSHEIRTPMNSILGFADVIFRESQDEETSKMAEYILISGRSLLKLINDILDMSKIESGKIEKNEENVDFSELIHEIAVIFTGHAQEKGLELIGVYPEDIPRYFIADVQKIRQILINLVGNAVKFTETGHVHIRCEADAFKDNSYDVKIHVEDTGRGIEDSEKGAVFQPFTQGESSEKIEGTGLGLAISKKLADFLDGSLLLADREGGGSIFTLSLTLKKAENPPEPENVSKITITQNFPPATLLIVDDYVLNIRLLKRFLKNQPFTILEAQSGEEALEILEKNRVDIAFLDLRMPGMSGYEVAARIRASSEYKGLKIIALTASAMTSDEKTLFEKGFDSFVRKPYNLDDILKVIGGLLS